MAERVTEEYRRHKLLSAFHGGAFKGRVWKNQQLLTEIVGASLEAVLEQLRGYVDSQIVAEASGRKQPTDMNKYIESFREILGSLSEGQLAMLREHYHAPLHRITATQLAQAANYSNYNAANLQYGNIGKALYDVYPLEIDRRSDGSMIYTFMLATGAGDDVEGKEWVWEMRPEVTSAIKALGLDY